jgi:hypothetical protein
MESAVASEPIPINSRVKVVESRSSFLGQFGIVSRHDPEDNGLLLEMDGGKSLWFCAGELELAPPTMEDVVIGAHRWQQGGELRRASISLTGHVVEVWVTVLPDMSARRIKFLAPFSAEQTIKMLDGLANGPPGTVIEAVDARSQLVADLGAMSRPVYSVDGEGA